ncbi:MAG: hypothetical protein WA095_01580, partial [Minisyncoccia bacterium]
MKKYISAFFIVAIVFGLFSFNIKPTLAKTRSVSSGAECPSVLDDFSDNAPPRLAYVNKHALNLYVGEDYSNHGGRDYGAIGTRMTNLLSGNLKPIVVTALDPLPSGLTSIKQDEITYGREITTYVNGVLVSSKGPWLRLFIPGSPKQVGDTLVRIKAEFMSEGVPCVETGFINFHITKKKDKSTPPPPPPIDTTPSAGGKIRFIKEAVKPIQRDPNGSVTLEEILAIKDK